MELQINGQTTQVDANTNVERLLARLELNPQLVVVELNRDILTADCFSKTTLNQGDVLEIVQFVGGG